MSLILDLLILLIFASCVYFGVKRGFIKSVMSIIIVVAAVIGSASISPRLGDYLNTNYISPIVTEKVSAALHSALEKQEPDTPVPQSDPITSEVTDTIPSVTEDLLSDLLGNADGSIEALLQRLGVDIEELKSLVNNSEGLTEEKIDDFVNKVALPLSEALSRGIAFTAIYILISLVLSVVLAIVDKIAKLPILNGLNKTLGLLFGILKGALIAWGLCLILYNTIPYISIIWEGTIPPDLIEGTRIVKLLGSVDILGLK